MKLDLNLAQFLSKPMMERKRMNHILFDEDDQTIASAVKYSLTREGFDISLSHHVDETRGLLKNQRFDLGLPDGSGYTPCEEIRAAGATPVIILSAKDDG